MFSPFFNKKSFLTLVFLTLAALAGNYFTLDLFFGISFLFGSIASLIVLYLFGNTWGVLVALVSSIQTIFLWHHPYAVILFVLEVFFIALLRRQNQNLLLLDMFYWLLSGMPLGWVFYSLVLNLENTQFLLIIFKQAVNGINNALIATLATTYLPLNRWLNRPQVENKISLQTNLLNLLICCLFLPLLLLIILDNNRVVNHLVENIQADITLTSNLTTNELQFWHQTRIEQLTNLAQIAIGGNIKSSDKLQYSTELIQKLSPYFCSISIENALGDRIAFAGGIQNTLRATSDNIVIEHAKTTLKPVTSDANHNYNSDYR